MADSFIDGCYDPKKTSPDQLYPLLYKTSAAAEIALCQLHFHGTKVTPYPIARNHVLSAGARAEELLINEFDQKLINSISITSFSEKLVLEFNKSHDYDPNFIVSEFEFRFEHQAHLFSFHIGILYFIFIVGGMSMSCNYAKSLCKAPVRQLLKSSVSVILESCWGQRWGQASEPARWGRKMTTFVYGVSPTGAKIGINASYIKLFKVKIISWVRVPCRQ